MEAGIVRLEGRINGYIPGYRGKNGDRITLIQYPEYYNQGSVTKDAEKALQFIHEMEIENKS